ncbi:peptidoglycan bridge formation glycyltransferase FemA/FemB family protein [Patescibacteria group bacterium]|nr:peptidoglycan bridge formation glycyltransferase FemA/FemB family protein [Patescibacteria group bacterium]
MIIKIIEDKKIWEDFLLKCGEKTFLQSWNWGEFNKIMGDKIWRFGIYENANVPPSQGLWRASKCPAFAPAFAEDMAGKNAMAGKQMSNLIAVALVVKITAKRGTFLLVPHGPIIKTQNAKRKTQNYNLKLKADILKILLEELKKIAKEEKCWFIRINPIWQRSEENNEVFKKQGFRKAAIHAHPEASWKLDITSSEQELLTGMRKTTRYLIKQAIKNKNLEVKQSCNLEDVENFFKMHQETAKRHHFVPFSCDYLKNEFSVFKQDEQIVLFLGEFQGKIIAFSFVIFWSGIGFYHHAALLPEYHKIPIAYLLQWSAIKEAKKRGCALYDFWGYVEPKSNHPWSGPSLFKMGFSGQAHRYIETQDLPISWKYWLTWVFEKIRKSKRGL